MAVSKETQIVLITGANQGIGLATAQILAGLPGYHILVGARDATRGKEAVSKLEAEAPKSAVSLLVIDITNDQSIASAIDEVKSKFGRLDVLVNNAAIALDSNKEYTLRERFRQTYDANVTGTAALTEAALPLLELSEFPRIVNVSSTLGSIKSIHDSTEPSYITYTAYSSSKSALNSLTVHYAKSFQKIKPTSRVVSVCPGFNATNLNNYSGPHPPSFGGAGVARLVTAGPDSEYKTGQFWDQAGTAQVPW